MQNRIGFRERLFGVVFTVILASWGCGTSSHSPRAEAIAVQEKEFEKILSSQESELDHCFYKLKKKDEKRILVFLQYEIQKEGQIRHVEVEKNGVFAPSATQCAANILSRLHMPRPLAGATQLKRVYSFGFTVQKLPARTAAAKNTKRPQKRKQVTADHAQDLKTLNAQLQVYEKWNGKPAHYNDLLDWAKAYEGEFKQVNEILTQVVPLLYIAKYRQVEKDEAQKWRDAVALELKNYTNEFPLLVGEEPQLALRQACFQQKPLHLYLICPWRRARKIRCLKC